MFSFFYGPTNSSSQTLKIHALLTPNAFLNSRNACDDKIVSLAFIFEKPCNCYLSNNFCLCCSLVKCTLVPIYLKHEVILPLENERFLFYKDYNKGIKNKLQFAYRIEMGFIGVTQEISFCFKCSLSRNYLFRKFWYNDKLLRKLTDFCYDEP